MRKVLLTLAFIFLILGAANALNWVIHAIYLENAGHSGPEIDRIYHNSIPSFFRPFYVAHFKMIWLICGVLLVVSAFIFGWLKGFKGIVWTILAAIFCWIYNACTDVSSIFFYR